MYSKRQILVAVIVLFIAIGSLGYFLYYKTHYYLKTPKVKNLPSNESSCGSPGYLPMWSLEDIKGHADDEKNRILKLLQQTSTNEYLNSISVSIFYHKAGDKAGVDGTYINDDQQLNTSLPDVYKFYDLRPIEKVLKLNPRLLLKESNKQYFIEFTPQQQRDLIQKLIDIDVFSLDEPIDYTRFCRIRDRFDSLFEIELVDKNWIALSVYGTLYFDNTPKNKATIDAYIKWLEDSYLTELKRHPVDKWPWDW